jgi:hypothetical protein
MIVTAQRDQTIDRLPELPVVRSKVITKDRQIVDTSGETWKFRASGDGGRLLIINWSRFRERGYPLGVSDRALHVAKLIRRLSARLLEGDDCLERTMGGGIHRRVGGLPGRGA